MCAAQKKTHKSLIKEGILDIRYFIIFLKVILKIQTEMQIYLKGEELPQLMKGLLNKTQDLSLRWIFLKDK